MWESRGSRPGADLAPSLPTPDAEAAAAAGVPAPLPEDGGREKEGSLDPWKWHPSLLQTPRAATKNPITICPLSAPLLLRTFVSGWGNNGKEPAATPRRVCVGERFVAQMSPIAEPSRLTSYFHL